VAKAAAGIVLTKPGLGGIVASVRVGRVTFQRIFTYTLNSITKKIVQVLFLAVGLLMTGHAILTPLLMVIIMLTGDLLGMSLSTDNVRPSAAPNAWHIGRLTLAGGFMGISELVYCTAALSFGKFHLGLGLESLRTVAFLAIVFGNQATTYINRERRSMLSSCPSRWLLASSVVDILIASLLATRGMAMAAVPILMVAGLLAAAAAFSFALDAVKGPVFARLKIG
jgi:H+-transporting ATPase